MCVTEEPGSRTDTCSIALNATRGRDAHHILVMPAGLLPVTVLLQCHLCNQNQVLNIDYAVRCTGRVHVAVSQLQCAGGE